MNIVVYHFIANHMLLLVENENQEFNVKILIQTHSVSTKVNPKTNIYI